MYGTAEGIDADVMWFGPTDPRRLGYPTEKPPGLLRRIIEAGSQPGDLVMDPFCGCGWFIHVAEQTKRRWIGIDISPRAIDLVEKRIEAESGHVFNVEGLPTDIDGAEKLAAADKYAFQQWANSLVGAQDYKGGKKGADGGIDGIRYFQDIEDGKIVHRKVIVSVKGGEHVTLDHVKNLQKTVTDNGADVGLFVTLRPPTKPMRTQALREGYYELQSGRKILRTQILTVAELLDGKTPDMPDSSALGDRTFKRPPRIVAEAEQTSFLPHDASAIAVPPSPTKPPSSRAKRASL